MFIESGLLFPLLPGDSLLFTAGLIAASKSTEIEPFASIWTLVILIPIAAILGDQVGFYLGHRFGPGLFKDDARILRTEHLRAAEAFFAKWGAVALVLGRFVPIVRTFVPFVAGAGTMTYSTFALYNISGAIIWVGVCALGGYAFGNVPIVRDNFTLVALGIVFVSLLPIAVEFLRHRQSRAV